MEDDPQLRPSEFESYHYGLVKQGLITEQQAKRAVELHLSSRKQPCLSPKPTPVCYEQTPIPLYFNTRSNNDHSAPLDNLDSIELESASLERSEEIELNSRPGGDQTFVFQRAYDSNCRKSLGAKSITERNKFNRSMGRDHKGEPIEGFISKEEQDYLDNVKRLFPEYYPGYR